METQTFTIKKATRQGVKPLIGLYSESGCGKTYSSLLLARGLVGPTGKIVMIDSESGRGSLYADVLPGGYETLQLDPPFSPARYIQAVQAIEQSGAQIGVIDSASHEWEGLGSVLDMASELEAKNGKSLNNWRVPKMEHSKFMLRLLQSPLPWIVCLRSKYKTRQIKGTKEMAEAGSIRNNEIGKSLVVKDDYTTPIQADDFIFEMTAHAEILHDHSINLTKCSHPSLRECFPKTGPIEIKHGELIAKWCAAPGGSKPTPTTAVNPELKKLKKELWDLTQKEHGGNPMALNQFLWDEGIQQDTESIEEMGIQRIAEVLAKVKAKLEPQPSLV